MSDNMGDYYRMVDSPEAWKALERVGAAVKYAPDLAMAHSAPASLKMK